LASKAQIRRELQIMVKTERFGLYLDGARQFLRAWHHKTPADIRGLIGQIQAVIVQSRPMALEIFGSRAVFFFERLDVEAIDWKQGK
jgi:hypothetical protein